MENLKNTLKIPISNKYAQHVVHNALLIEGLNFITKKEDGQITFYITNIDLTCAFFLGTTVQMLCTQNFSHKAEIEKKPLII